MGLYTECPLPHYFDDIPGVIALVETTQTGPSSVTISFVEQEVRQLVEVLMLRKIREINPGSSTHAAWMQWCAFNCKLCSPLVSIDDDGAVRFSRHNYEPGYRTPPAFSIKEYIPKDEFLRSITIVFIDDDENTVMALANHYSAYCTAIAIHVSGEEMMDSKMFSLLQRIISSAYPTVCVIDKNMSPVNTEKLLLWMHEYNIFTVMFTGEPDTRKSRSLWADVLVTKIDFNISTEVLDKVLIPRITQAQDNLRNQTTNCPSL